MPIILIDTNVLIYLYDLNDPDRQARARLVLDTLQQYGNGRLSVQCLSEFANIAPRKLQGLVGYDEVSEQVHMLSRAWPIYLVTPAIVAEAAQAVWEYKLSYYDAQIWACAKFNQVPIVFSEDFQDGLTLEGVQFVNPFTEKFNIKKWM